MSTPTSPEGQDEPRYGRRLDPENTPPATPPEGAAPGASQPAPQYGQPAPQYGQPAPNYGAPAYGQQSPPPYGAPPAYGAPGTYPGQRPPRRAGAIISIVVGALLMIGAPIAGLIIGALMALGGFSGLSDMAEIDTVRDGSTVRLEANRERAVFVEASSGDRMHCAVTDPAGQPVNVTTYHLGAPDGSGTALTGVTFRTTTAGDYTIDCDLPASANGPIMVSDPLNLDDFAGAGVVIIIGFLIGLAGLVLLIIGIVWLVRVNRRIREARGW